MPRPREDKSVRLSMTGEEFKQLIERRNEDGIVNTLQEVMAMFEGIGDNETIVDYVRRVAVTDDAMPEDSIGREQMKNGAVSMDKLADDVKQQMVSVDDIGTIGTDTAKTIVADAIAKAEAGNENETENE